MTNTREEELRDEITSIIYGADWKDTDVVDAFKPDVEAVMKLVRTHFLNEALEIINKIKVRDDKDLHVVGIELLEAELNNHFGKEDIVKASVQENATMRSNTQEELEKAISLLRQWLNEERIKDPKRFVTNEELHQWLDIGIESHTKRAEIKALRNYLENGEWFKTDQAGYVTQRGVFEKHIEKLEQQLKELEQ